METVVATVVSDSAYFVGVPDTAVGSIADNDGPSPLVPEESCGCSASSTEVVKTASGVGGGNAKNTSEGPVRYIDGTLKIGFSDLTSSGFGDTWGVTRLLDQRPRVSDREHLR